MILKTMYQQLQLPPSIPTTEQIMAYQEKEREGSKSQLKEMLHINSSNRGRKTFVDLSLD